MDGLSASALADLAGTTAAEVRRLSLAFLETAPYRRWAVRSDRPYRQVSQDTGIPLEALGGILESMGFARPVRLLEARWA